MKNKTGIGPKVIVGILMVYLFLPFFITLVYSLTDMWNITVLPESYTLTVLMKMLRPMAIQKRSEVNIST